MEIRLKLSIFWKEALGFIGVEILAIAAGLKFLAQKPEYTQVTFSIPQFIIAFLIATFLLIGLIKVIKGGLFFKIFFSFVLWIGIQILFGAVFSDFVSIVLAFLVVLGIFIIPRVWMWDMAIILGISGVATILGMNLAPFTVIIILVILSIYDIVAVYLTKHMVWMAKEISKRGVMFGFIIPAKMSSFNQKIEQVRFGKGGFMLLGTGDLALPVVLVVSSLSYGLWGGVTVGIAALFGLFLTHVLFVRKERPMPALPPIALCSILGFLIMFFFVS